MVDETTLIAGGVLSGLINRNREKAGPMYDKNAYNADMNVSAIRKKVDASLEEHIENMVNMKIVENLEMGLDRETGVDAIRGRFDELPFNYFIDELRDIIEQSRNATTKREVNTQLQRLDATYKRLQDADMNADDKQFIQAEFQNSRMGIDTGVKDRKMGMGGVIGESLKAQVSNYMDMRSLFSGLVGNNPLAMAMYGIGSDVTRGFFENKKRNKQQLQEDTLKTNNMEIDQRYLQNKKDRGQLWDETFSAYDDTPRIEPSYGGSTQSEMAQEERMDEMRADRIESDTGQFRDGVFERMDRLIELATNQSEESPVAGKDSESFLDKMGLAVDPKAMGMKLLRGAGIAAMIASLVNGLFQGIKEGWNAWVETGSISEAIYEGATALLSGMTFGLIDKDTFQNFFDTVGGWIGKKVFEMVSAIKDGFEGLLDSVAEKVPFWDSKREAKGDDLMKDVFTKGDKWWTASDDKVDTDRISKLTDEELEILADEGNRQVRMAVKSEQAARSAVASDKNVKLGQNITQKSDNKSKEMSDAEWRKWETRQNIINNTVVNTNNISGGGDNPTIPLSSARNPDSTVQRLTDRSMSYSW